MSKGGSKTTTTALDPSSQGYVNQMRTAGQSGYNATMGAGPLFLGADPRTIEEQMAPFMNPYQSQVIDATRGEFDHLRAGARRSTSDAMIKSGAFGGSRHGVAEGVRMGELDRAQTSQISGLLQSGYNNALQQGLGYSEYQRSLRERQMQEPLYRHQNALSMMNMGMGPTGTQTTEKIKSDPWGQLLGLGLTGLSLWNPFAGAAVGAVAGGSMDNWGGGTNA